MLNFHWYKFLELSLEQLYKALALRAAVFVVEQNCVYLDPDYTDMGAIHLLGMDNNQLAAYLRLFPPTASQEYVKFGRIVTANFTRGKGCGKQLMQELLNYCAAHYQNFSIQCSAQLYLKNFYESFGFKANGDVYDEDGIPHIAMRKET